MQHQYPRYTGPVPLVDGDLSPEMSNGASGIAGRKPPVQMQRPFAWIDTIPSNSVEFYQGSQPHRGRQRLGPRIGLPLSQTTHVQAAFSQEMVVVNLVAPVRNRSRLAPRFQQYFGDMRTVATVGGAQHGFLLTLRCGR